MSRERVSVDIAAPRLPGSSSEFNRISKLFTEKFSVISKFTIVNSGSESSIEANSVSFLTFLFKAFGNRRRLS